MGRPSTAESARVRDLVHECQEMAEGAPPILATLSARLVETAGVDAAFGWAVRWRERYELTLFEQAGFPRSAERLFAGFLATAPRRFGAFDPLAPERWQRNRPLATSALQPDPRARPTPVVKTFYPELGIGDHYRALICDGPSMLAYVGLVRHNARRPPPEDRRLLRAIVPALEHRLTMERALGHGTMWLAATIAALDEVPNAALLVGEGPIIHHANAVAAAWLERDRAEVDAALGDALRGRSTTFRLTPLRAPGMLRHWLALHRPSSVEPGARALVAARRWGLTPRQTEVLKLLARGMANKTIAAAIGCAENTVELHVGAIMRKVGVATRAEVIVAVWATG